MGLIRDLHAMQASPVKAFHDDQALQAYVLGLVQRYGIRTFIETGTFRGDTLAWFAERNPHVECYSCETNSLYFRTARFRTALRSNVHIKQIDSRVFLEEVHSVADSPVLLWLDAHWGNDHPLPGELDVLNLLYRKWIALIDDFQIPERPGFGFDSYWDRPINLEYISPHLPKEREVWLPDYDPPKDSRGVCAIFRGLSGVPNASFRRVE